MNKLSCIVHYENQSPYSEIKTLSEVNIRRIEEAKQKKNELGGVNQHQEQIQQIPEKIDVLSHGVHLDPCYKRYCLYLLDLGYRKYQNSRIFQKSYQYLSMDV